MTRQFEDALEQAEAFADALWGGMEGHVAVMLGLRGQRTDSGGYAFKQVRNHYPFWPDERDDFLPDLVDESYISDVFVGPLLRSEPSRKKSVGHAIAGRHLYADLDPGDTPRSTAQEEALNRLKVVPGTMLVSSGRPGHEHAYVPLRRVPSSVDVLETYNRRLAATVGADSGWAENKVLRLPGTWNHKPRPVGLLSLPVTLTIAPQRRA